MIRSLATIKIQRIKKKHKCKTPALGKCPQKLGMCIKASILIHPKKPNSAKRSVVRIRLFSGKTLTAFIPGEENSLKQHAEVFIRGGHVPDLPGVRYKVIRGVKDCLYVSNRVNKRSKYGLKIKDAFLTNAVLIKKKYPNKNPI